jgi:hypothetical protein
VENFNLNDRVIYLGCTDEQVNWGNNDDPRKILVEGAVYYIKDVEVHSQHTKLTLHNICGKFNSVCFSKIKK